MTPEVHRHEAVFRYGSKQIPFVFWSRVNEVLTVDTVVFLGSNQTGRITRWVAQNAPAGTAIIDGLPHRQADRSGRDLPTFSREYAAAACRAVLQVFDITSVHIVALSQAVPGAVWMALQYSELVRNVTLVAPLGFTSSLLGDSPRSRLRELKKRTVQTALQPAQSPLRDVRNAYFDLVLLRAMLHDVHWRVSGRKYATGASQDLREDCRTLALQQKRRGATLTVMVGEADKMFPPHEVLAVLEAAQIAHLAICTLPGLSHSSLATQRDQLVLAGIIATVRGTNV